MKNDSVKSKITKNQKGFTPHLKAESIKIAKGSRLLSAGFTLIEVTVTIMVFTIMMILVSSIFARAIEIERRVVWSQRVQENATLVLESMAKEIRVSEIVNQDTPNCTVPATTLTMNHPTACGGSPCNVTYTLTGNNVQRQVDLVGTDFISFVNSTDVQFTRLNFCITGSGINDDQSPKVTILTSLKSTKGSPPSSVNLQTSVTSRDITTELQNP
ncbi:MAG: prepilin-type N-terminal cleavage/methylation domain-containing protein [Candidatus Taylorbacteria bacterium]|nr:prepilin-type N-terminal cleavage/methylation domain-containing protein [Candidatus Taylorbacteria bacterium]